SSRAVPADAAAPRPVHEHAVAFVERSDTLADGRDRARRLVPEREGKVPRQRSLGPLLEMEVGVAEAGGLDLEDDTAGRRLRRLDVAQLRLYLPADELNRLQPQPSSIMRDCCENAGAAASGSFRENCCSACS